MQQIEPDVVANPALGQENKPRIFRADATWGACFLGGPPAAGYIIAHNYKILGEHDKVKKTWVVTVLATLVIFWIGSQFEELLGKSHFFALAYSGAAYAIITWLQGDKISEYVGNGGPKYSGWRAAGVGLISGLVLLVVIVGYLFLADPTFSMAKKEFGKTDNQIYYDRTFESAEIDKFAAVFTEIGFFNDDQQVGAFIKEQGNAYEVSFPLVENAWNNPETIAAFREVKDILQAKFPGNKLVVNLCAPDDIGNPKRTIR